MKKYKLAAGIALFSSILMAGGTVFADDNYPKERNTNAQVQFTEDETVTPPTDPSKPGGEDEGGNGDVDPVDPTKPTEPTEPGTSGPLSLDYASALDFGEQKISVKDQTYYAKPQLFRDKDGNIDKENPAPNYAQITDKRGGEKGWSLSVKQNGQFTSETEGKELTGAEITFNNGQTASASSSDAPSTVKESFSLSPDGNGNAEQVMAASEGEGWGTWIYRFGDKDKDNIDKSIELNVPGSTQKDADTYKTSLTWSLSDVPGNDA